MNILVGKGKTKKIGIVLFLIQINSNANEDTNAEFQGKSSTSKPIRFN